MQGVMELKVMTTTRGGEHLILLTEHSYVELATLAVSAFLYTGCWAVVSTVNFYGFVRFWGSNLSSVHKVNANRS